jgi:hypothetical protein
VVLPPEREATAAMRVVARILRCGTCGAAVTYQAEAQAPKCGFCGTVMHVETPTDPVEQAELVIPFSVPQNVAQDALRRWLKSLKWFRPNDLVSASTVEQLHPLWWAAWRATAKASVSWAADSNASSGRSAWAPHTGQTQMRFSSLVIPASRGLTPAECFALTPYFDLATAVRPDALSPQDLGRVEHFDMQRSAARRYVLDAIERTAAGEMRAGQIPGSSFRNVKVSVLLDGLDTDRIALPSYVLAYRYDGKLYRAIVHGQRPEVTFGDAPRSWWKILGLIAGILGGLTLLLVLAFLFLVLLGSMH